HSFPTRRSSDLGADVYRPWSLRRALPEHAVGALMIDQRIKAIADPYACHLAEQHAMRREILRLDKLAVERGERSRQYGSAQGLGFPLGQRKAFLLRKAGETGKRVGERALLGGQRIQRENAVLCKAVIVRFDAVEADENRRRIVRYGTCGNDGHAAAPIRAVGRHHMHRTGKTAHRLPIEARLDSILLQHRVSRIFNPIAYRFRQARNQAPHRTLPRSSLLRPLPPAFTKLTHFPRIDGVGKASCVPPSHPFSWLAPSRLQASAMQRRSGSGLPHRSRGRWPCWASRCATARRLPHGWADNN